jgi:hypothetical protein
LAAIASSTKAAASNAAGEPDPITVMLPASAATEPPDTGASSISRPTCSRRAAKARAASGAMVVQQSTTQPAGNTGTQPDAPNKTSLACAAFTTNTTTAARSGGNADATSTAWPPSAANASRTARRGSQP